MSVSSSWLFVPGDRPDRFDKAATSGADQVILDLEDAVAVPAKTKARGAAGDWLSGGGSGWVRVNGPGTPWFDSDLTAVSGLPGLRGLVVPKADSLVLARAGIDTAIPVVALVETAAGIRDAFAVAAHRGVVGLAFGSVDLAADLGCDDAWESLLHARSRLVLAARAAGLPRPIDGVHLGVRDAETTGRLARRARSLGFAGKLCVHPDQVPVVRDAFAPTPDEIAWATRMAQAVGGPTALDDDALASLLVVDGEMVDRPVLLRARRILQHPPRDLH